LLQDIVFPDFGLLLPNDLLQFLFELLALLLLFPGRFLRLLEPVCQVLDGQTHHLDVLSGFLALGIDPKGFLKVLHTLPPPGKGFLGVTFELLLTFRKDNVAQVVLG